MILSLIVPGNYTLTVSTETQPYIVWVRKWKIHGYEYVGSLQSALVCFSSKLILSGAFFMWGFELEDEKKLTIFSTTLGAKMDMGVMNVCLFTFFVESTAVIRMWPYYDTNEVIAHSQ